MYTFVVRSGDSQLLRNAKSAMYKYLLLLYYIKVQGEASQVGKSPPSCWDAASFGSRTRTQENMSLRLNDSQL
jgi:hypothetical protein